MRLTSRIASRTLFGTDVGAEVEEIEPAGGSRDEGIAVRFRRPFPIPDSVPTRATYGTGPRSSVWMTSSTA